MRTNRIFFSLNNLNSNHVDIIRNASNNVNNANVVNDRYCTYHGVGMHPWISVVIID